METNKTVHDSLLKRNEEFFITDQPPMIYIFYHRYEMYCKNGKLIPKYFYTV